MNIQLHYKKEQNMKQKIDRKNYVLTFMSEILIQSA